jgi:hypothetical protein
VANTFSCETFLSVQCLQLPFAMSTVSDAVLSPQAQADEQQAAAQHLLQPLLAERNGALVA